MRYLRVAKFVFIFILSNIIIFPFLDSIDVANDHSSGTPLQTLGELLILRTMVQTLGTLLQTLGETPPPSP